MNRPAAKLELLLKTGASISVDGSKYSIDDLVTFAKIALVAGGHLTIRNSDKHPTDKLVKISNAAPRAVTFEFGAE